ncbi:MAG: hypothetical protein ABII27_05035 [bacterium]
MRYKRILSLATLCLLFIPISAYSNNFLAPPGNISISNNSFSEQITNENEATQLTNNLQNILIRVPAKSSDLTKEKAWEEVIQYFYSKPTKVMEKDIPTILKSLDGLPEAAVSYSWEDGQHEIEMYILKLKKDKHHNWLQKKNAVCASCFMRDSSTKELLAVHILRNAGPEITLWEEYTKKRYQGFASQLPQYEMRWWKEISLKNKPDKIISLNKKTIPTLNVKPWFGIWATKIENNNLLEKFLCYLSFFNSLKREVGYFPPSRIENFVNQLTDRKEAFVGSAVVLAEALLETYSDIQEIKDALPADPLEAAEKIRVLMTDKKGILRNECTPSTTFNFLRFILDKNINYFKNVLDLRLAVLDQYPELEKLKEDLDLDDPLAAAEQIRHLLTNAEGILNADLYVPIYVGKFINYLAGKDHMYLSQAISLRMELLDIYPDLKKLKSALPEDPLESAEQIRLLLTDIDGQLNSNYTPINFESFLRYAKKRKNEYRYLNNAIQVRLAFLNEFPDLKKMKKILNNNPFECSESIRILMTDSDGGINKAYTPLNIGSFISYASGKRNNFIEPLVRLRLALLKDYPDLKSLRIDLVNNPDEIAKKLQPKLYDKKGKNGYKNLDNIIKRLYWYVVGIRVRNLLDSMQSIRQKDLDISH